MRQRSSVGEEQLKLKCQLDEKQYLEYFHIFRDLQHGQRDGGAGEEGRGSLPDI